MKIYNLDEMSDAEVQESIDESYDELTKYLKYKDRLKRRENGH